MILLLLTPLIVFLALFFILPLGVMLEQSLFLSPIRSSGNTATTLANYREIFGDFFYLRVLLQTVVLGVGVTALTLAFGYPVAYFVARTHTRWRQVLVFLILSPLVVSIVIRSFGWMVLLGPRGTINNVLMGLDVIHAPLELIYNWFGVVVAMTHVLLPFMILTLASVIEGIPVSMEESAAVLGATNWARFRHVVVPLSMEGIGAGLTLVFMLAIGSYVSVMLVGGSDTLVLPLAVYQQVNLLNNNFAAALATLLLAFSIVVLYFQARAFRVRGTA